MEVTLRHYGNSKAVVIPPSVLAALQIDVGQVMLLSTQNGNIILTPKRHYTLEAMIAQCEPKALPPADLATWDAASSLGAGMA